MKKILFAVLFAVAGSAHAIPISQPHDIDRHNSVGYSFFTVTGQGLFDVRAENQRDGRAYRPWWRGGQYEIDPQMYLFRDHVSRHTLLGGNDDGGTRFDAELSNWFLAPGNYVVAVSDYYLSVNEAIRGHNNHIFPGTIDVVVAEGNRRYNRRHGYNPEAHFTVPEPGTLALMGLGLVAAFGVARRRKSAAA